MVRLKLPKKILKKIDEVIKTYPRSGIELMLVSSGETKPGDIFVMNTDEDNNYVGFLN